MFCLFYGVCKLYRESSVFLWRVFFIFYGGCFVIIMEYLKSMESVLYYVCSIQTLWRVFCIFYGECKLSLRVFCIFYKACKIYGECSISSKEGFCISYGVCNLYYLWIVFCIFYKVCKIYGEYICKDVCVSMNYF